MPPVWAFQRNPPVERAYTFSDPQAELAALLVQDVEFGVDTDCLAEKTEELSDEQAEFLIDNIDAEDTEGFDAELQAWVASPFDCVSDVLGEETE